MSGLSGTPSGDPKSSPSSTVSSVSLELVLSCYKAILAEGSLRHHPLLLRLATLARCLVTNPEPFSFLSFHCVLSPPIHSTSLSTHGTAETAEDPSTTAPEAPDLKCSGQSIGPANSGPHIQVGHQ